MKGLGGRQGSLHVRVTSVDEYATPEPPMNDQESNSANNNTNKKNHSDDESNGQETIHAPLTNEVAFGKSILSNRSSNNGHMLTMHESKEMEFNDSIQATKNGNHSRNNSNNITLHDNTNFQKNNSIYSMHSIVPMNSKMRRDSYLFNKDAKRWDLIFLAYMFSIFSTTAAFGASHNSEYNHIIFFFVFIHFAAETVVSWNFIFSSKVAKYLSIITTIIYLLQAFVMVPFVTDIAIMRQLSAVEFVWSDTLSAVSSISMMLNGKTRPEIRRAAAVVGFHFVGVSLTFWMLPIIWYVDSDPPQYGEGWVLIGLSGLPQFYYVKDILQSRINHVTNDDIQWQSKRFKFIAQFISLVLPCLGVVGFGFLAIYRTTESVYITAFARGVWADVILVLGYPEGCFSIILLLYWWRKGRAMYFDERARRMSSHAQTLKNNNVIINSDGIITSGNSGSNTVSKTNSILNNNGINNNNKENLKEKEKEKDEITDDLLEAAIQLGQIKKTDGLDNSHNTQTSPSGQARAASYRC